MDPHIEQYEGQGNQDEPVGWVLGRRPAAHLATTALAGLHAKPLPIELAGITRGAREVNLDEEQPLRTPGQPPRAPGGSENSADTHQGGKRRAVRAFEMWTVV
jgi:hypothetical protein